MGKYRNYSIGGVVIAIVLFLATAMLPSLVYGGYVGLLLAGGMLGVPVLPTVLARLIVTFGMVLGVVAVASIYAVGGAVCGALVGHLCSRTAEEFQKDIM